jgi:hypothetical protein
MKPRNSLPPLHDSASGSNPEPDTSISTLMPYLCLDLCLDVFPSCFKTNVLWLGLHNKPKAEVHPGHKLTGPKEEEERFMKFWLPNLCYMLCPLLLLWVALPSNNGEEWKWCRSVYAVLSTVVLVSVMWSVMPVIMVFNYLIYLYCAWNARINALRRVRVNVVAVEKQ